LDKYNISYIPLYLQAKDVILKRIVDNEYKPGDKIHSELDLSKEFKISISTIRQALSILVSNGYLVKKQGKGTYVAKRKVKLSFLSWVGETKKGMEIIRKLISLFEEKYPMVEVKYIPTTYLEIRRTLLEMISSGNAPDVAQIVSHWTSYFASMGAFEPLDDLLSKENLANRFYEKDLLGGLYHNRIYSVSWGLCPVSLIVNKNVLKDLEVKLPNLPMDLNDFSKLCEVISTKYQDKDKYCYGICESNDEIDFLRIYTFLQAFNGGFIDKNGEVIFNSTKNIEGFKWIRHFVKNNKIYSDDIYMIRKRFAKAKIAFISDGPWIRYLLEELTGDDFEKNFKIVLNPTLYNSKSYSWSYNHALAICSQSVNKMYAAKFIDTVTNDYEISNWYYSKVGHLPVNKKYINNSIYNNDFYNTYKKQLNNATVINAQNSMFEKAMLLCKDAVDKILNEGSEIEKELNEKQYYLKMLYYD